MKNQKFYFTSSENLSYDEKIRFIKEKFHSLANDENRYRHLMEIGKSLPKISPEFIIEEKLVKGCQSKLYLHSEFENGKVYFTAFSDALISSGLAALLIEAYSGESPDLILKRPPDFLHEIGIFTSLSPSRSNGLSQIHLKMKQEALKYLLLSAPK